jgi:hypothetical protein
MKIMLLLTFLFSYADHTGDKPVIPGNISTGDTPSFSSGNILWEQTIQSFGTIHEGKKIDAAYTFKNTQRSNVTSINAYPECGCLSVIKPVLPILPGKSATLYIHLNTNSRKGAFSKSVYVTTNIDTEPKKLTLEGNITE